MSWKWKRKTVEIPIGHSSASNKTSSEKSRKTRAEVFLLFIIFVVVTIERSKKNIYEISFLLILTTTLKILCSFRRFKIKRNTGFHCDFHAKKCSKSTWKKIYFIKSTHFYAFHCRFFHQFSYKLNK
jgi:hypothetical protein